MTTPHSKEEEEEQMNVLCNTNTHSKRSWMTAMKDEDACSSSSLPLSNQCPSTSNSSTKEYYYYMKNDHGLVGKTKRTSHNSWNSIINNNNNNNATLKDDENHHDSLYQNYNLSTKRRRPCRQTEPNTIRTLSTDHPQSSIQQHYPYNNHRDYYYCCYNQEEQTNNEWVHDNGNNQDDSFQACSTPTNNNHHIHNTIKNQYDVTMKSERSREEVPCVLPTNNNKDPIPIHDDHSTKRRKTLNNNETILQQNEPWYELNTTTSLPIKMHAPLSVATTTTTITPSCSNWWWQQQQQQQRVTKDPVDAKLEQLIRQSMHEAKQQQQQQQQQQQSSLSSTMMMEIDDDDDACY